MAKTPILVLYACMMASCVCAGPISYSDYQDILSLPYEVDPDKAKPEPGLVDTLRSLDLHGPVRSLSKTAPAQNMPDKLATIQAIYDKSGHQIAEKSYEDGRLTVRCVYRFDRRGRLLSRTGYNLSFPGHPWWQKTVYVRNKWGYVTGYKVFDPNGGGYPEGDQPRYDSHGRPVYYHPVAGGAMSSEEYKYHYDSRGRLIRQIRYHSVRDPNVEVGFIWTHDDTSYRIRGLVTYIVADGYGYYKVRKDSKGRIAALQGPSFTQRISYNSAGNPLKVRIYWKDARSEIDYSYDRHGNLVGSRNELTQAGGICKITSVSYRYVYDSHGNWTSRTSSTGEKLVRKLEYY